jgi:hypothetical protein
MDKVGKVIIKNSEFEMSKTKTMRIKYDDAFIIEQAVRELAADLQKEITVSDFLSELIKDVEKSKERYKEKINKTSL